VPLVIISTYARKGYISHTQYEFSSLLKFAEVRFRLPPLTERDSTAGDMLDSFEFNQRPLPPLILQERICPVAPYLRWWVSTLWSRMKNRWDEHERYSHY
jgi:phospholipase C